MYLNRVPKVSTLKELATMNERLNVAYLNNTLSAELKAIGEENNYIYDIDISVNKYVDIDKYKTDPQGWGNLIDLNIRVAYWRKFNALHAWFVNNVQGGEMIAELILLLKSI